MATDVHNVESFVSEPGFNEAEIDIPNGAVKWLALLLRIREVSGSTTFHILPNSLFINRLIAGRSTV
jgi:hypothetical protein